MAGEILSEEKGVRRCGDVVERPAHPWSANIQCFLEHLRRSSLPVEHILDIADGKERFVFTEAEMVHPNRWEDEALYRVGELTAALHRSGRTFRSPSADCQSWCLREIGKGERIWCHGDIAPWNLLTKNGMPYQLVDWEFSGPLDPFVELARVCWLFPQLVDDDLQALYSLPPPEKRAEQVRIICEGYGLEPSRRIQLVEQIIEVIICETAHEAIDPGVSFEDKGCLWGFAWRTRSLYWVWRNRQILEAALK